MRVDHYQKGLCGRLIGYYRLQLYNKTKNNQYRQRQIISYKSALIQKSCALCDKKCKEATGDLFLSNHQRYRSWTPGEKRLLLYRSG